MPAGTNPQPAAKTAKKPAYICYSVKDRDRGRDSIWTRIGAAWPHDDGQGLTIQLDALPLGEQITLRVPSDKND